MVRDAIEGYLGAVHELGWPVHRTQRERVTVRSIPYE
jgi:hypothetical protein